MKRILITTCVLAFVPLLVWGQSPSTETLTVTTSPPGAEVVVDGDATVVGVSPATFTFPLMGEYKLTVRKPGYEKYSTRLLIDPTAHQQVDVALSPKTAFKAAIRSMVLPGWGQYYQERKTKGFLIGTLFAGAMVAVVATDSKFRDREDDYLARLAEYDAAVAAGSTYQELSSYHSALVSAQDDAYKAEDDRRLATGIAAGIWGLSLLDALLSSGGDRSTFSVKGVAVSPSVDQGKVGLTLSGAF